MLSFDIKREDLLEIVIQAFGRGSITSINLLVGHNEVAKTFTPSELCLLEQAILLGVQKSTELYDLVISSNVYVKEWGAGTFINKLPFSYIKHSGNIVGGRTGYKFFYRDLTFPHWIDKDMSTGDLQGWRLVNHIGRQNLPKLKRDYLKYAIITKPENASFYQKQHPTSRVYTYPEFYHFRAFHFEK